MSVLYPKYRHSVSSANLWRACPSAFVWRYGMQRWGKDNERIWMGKAAEAAYAHALIHGGTPEEVQADAVRRFYDASEGEEFPEAHAAGWIARTFIEETDPAWGKLLTHNPWRPISIGLNREVSLKPDFVFENAIVDTKATLRLPSESSAPHARQIVAYAREWEKPGVLFYATARKKGGEFVSGEARCLTVPEDMLEPIWNGLLLDWRQIDRFDVRFANAKDAMTVMPLDIESFYWDDDDKQEALSLWMEAA